MIFFSLNLDNIAKEVFRKAKKIAKDIEEKISSTTDKINLDKYCEEKIGSWYKNLSSFQISEISEKLVKKVKFYLQKKADDIKFSQRTTPSYAIPQFSNTVFRYDVLHREDSVYSLIIENRRKILKTLHKMPWKAFEFLCKYLLETQDLRRVEVNPTSRGADFFGIIEMEKFSEGILLKDAKIRVFGEAKRHSGKIGESEMIKFCKRYEDLVEGKKSIIRKLPKWFVDTKYPVLGMFITTSEFTRDAKSYVRDDDHSIILIEGEQIIEDLLKVQEVRDLWFTRKDGKLTFDVTLFINYFKEHDKPTKPI